jgi:hypothetical protein
LNQADAGQSLQGCGYGGQRSSRESISQFRANRDGEVGFGDVPQRGETDGGGSGARGSPAAAGDEVLRREEVVNGGGTNQRWNETGKNTR